MLRNSIVKNITQYYIESDGNVDAIVFTAGIGVNAISLIIDIVNLLENTLNIKLDYVANVSIAKFKEKRNYNH